MTEEHLPISSAKQKLGELVSRVAFGGEEFVIEVHGKARARLVSCQRHKPLSKEEEFDLLDRMTAFRKRIEARTGVQSDSAEIIRQMRDERDEQLFGRS